MLILDNTKIETPPYQGLLDYFNSIYSVLK